MVAYMAARSDPADYGRITLFSLPRARTVFGPTQVHPQILGGPGGSTELTPCRQRGFAGITLFSRARARPVFGPTQVHAQILADPDVSKELTLFNQQGSTVIFGNLLTVPIKDALLYVQPIFVQASQGAIPELRRVPVFFNNQLGYTANLADSIDQVLGQTTQAPPASSPQPP